MAVVTAGARSFNMDAWLDVFYSSSATTSGRSDTFWETEITGGTSDTFFRFEGAGFGPLAGSLTLLPVIGTVTGIAAHSTDGTVLFSASGFSVDAASLALALATG